MPEGYVEVDISSGDGIPGVQEVTGLISSINSLQPESYQSHLGHSNQAERNYSQLEKEGLACVFGVKRFYSYVFGHAFELVTDYKPLLGLLGEYTSNSSQASARIHHWSVYCC